MKTLFLVVFWIALANIRCFAQMTVKEFRETMAGGNANSVAMTKQLVLGMGAGIQIANAFERKVNAPALYCAPENLALNAENLIDIMKRTIANAPAGAVPDDAPISLVLLSGLTMTFPCTPK
jgi:hypothetical protein